MSEFFPEGGAQVIWRAETQGIGKINEGVGGDGQTVAGVGETQMAHILPRSKTGMLAEGVAEC